jgi:hypothetical protein
MTLATAPDGRLCRKECVTNKVTWGGPWLVAERKPDRIYGRQGGVGFSGLLAPGMQCVGLIFHPAGEGRRVRRVKV